MEVSLIIDDVTGSSLDDQKKHVARNRNWKSNRQASFTVWDGGAEEAMSGLNTSPEILVGQPYGRGVDTCICLNIYHFPGSGCILTHWRVTQTLGESIFFILHMKPLRLWDFVNRSFSPLSSRGTWDLSVLDHRPVSSTIPQSLPAGGCEDQAGA